LSASDQALQGAAVSGDLASALEALAAHANMNSLDASGYTRTPKSSDRDRSGWLKPTTVALHLHIHLL